MAPILVPLKDRAERILKDLIDRNTTGLAAMDLLAALAKEKEAAEKELGESGLGPRAFGAYWRLKDDKVLAGAGVDANELALEIEKLLDRFPNASQNSDEERQLRAALYRPLLAIGKDDRLRLVDIILRTVLDNHD